MQLTSTQKMSFFIHALSCIMSLIETPMSAKHLANSAIPPGLSETVTVNLTKRPSAANPLSRHLPKIVVSMLPPQRGMTTLEIESRLYDQLNFFKFHFVKFFTFCLLVLVRGQREQLLRQMLHHPQQLPFPIQSALRLRWQSILQKR